MIIVCDNCFAREDINGYVNQDDLSFIKSVHKHCIDISCNHVVIELVCPACGDNANISFHTDMLNNKQGV